MATTQGTPAPAKTRAAAKRQRVETATAAAVKRDRTRQRKPALTVVPDPVETVAATLTDDEIAAMPRAARAQTALDEAKAKKVNPGMATPVSDWLAAHPEKRGRNAAKASAKSETGERGHRKYDSDTTAKLLDRIRAARQIGVSFPKLATQLNGESYLGATDWTGPKLYALACRHGIGQLPLVKPDKA